MHHLVLGSDPVPTTKEDAHRHSVIDLMIHTPPYLDKPLQLVVLLQQLGLLLLQGENVVRRLLQDGCLVGANT